MRKPKNNIFSELYFDEYEVSVNAKNIRYFEVEEHPLVKVTCTAANIFTNPQKKSLFQTISCSGARHLKVVNPFYRCHSR